MSNGIKKIIQRLGGEAEHSLITEAYSYLERSKGESRMVEKEFVSKERETEDSFVLTVPMVSQIQFLLNIKYCNNRFLKKLRALLFLMCMTYLTNAQCFVDKYLKEVNTEEESLIFYEILDSIEDRKFILKFNKDGSIFEEYVILKDTIPRCPVGEYGLVWGKWTYNHDKITVEKRSISLHDSQYWSKITYKVIQCNKVALKLKRDEIHFNRSIEYGKDWNDFKFEIK
jgi:hypothetical protein